MWKNLNDIYCLDSQSLSNTHITKLNTASLSIVGSTWRHHFPHAVPLCFLTARNHRRYPFAPLQLLHHAGPPVPHRATSNHSVCPSPGATRTPPDWHNLTGSKEQPGRAGSNGETSERKGRQRGRKRLRTAWLSAERDVKFTGMIWKRFTSRPRAAAAAAMSY